MILKGLFIFLCASLVNITASAQSTYMYFYTTTGAVEGQPEVAITEIIVDDSKTHYLFKLLNLKKRAELAMEENFPNYIEFTSLATDFSLRKEEAEAKREKLIAQWQKSGYKIHPLKFSYQNATGKEYPKN